MKIPVSYDITAFTYGLVFPIRLHTSIYGVMV